jgi:hypothetical protein
LKANLPTPFDVSFVFFVDGSLDKSFVNQKTSKSTNNPKLLGETKTNIKIGISFSKVSSKIGRMGITKIVDVVAPRSWELQQH